MKLMMKMIFGGNVYNKTKEEVAAIVNGIRNKEEGFEKSLESMESYFSTGHCMDLAIALHRRFGYEIQAAIVDDPDISWIGHAWVALPDGQFLDIMGKYTDSEELEDFGERTVVGLSEEGLREYIHNNEDIANDIGIAALVVSGYMKPLFGLKEIELNNTLNQHL